MVRRCLCLGLVLALAALGQLRAADQPPHAKIDPRALNAMKAMATYLAGLKSFAFEVEETVDEMHQPSSMMIQLTNLRKATVHRPCCIAASAEGDTMNRSFHSNSKTATLYDKDHNAYFTFPCPDSFEKLFDELHEKYEISLPLAELVMAKPDSTMLERVDEGHYVGLHSVEGVKCHHILCSQKNLEWQLWIDAGPKPLPKKFVITYVKMNGYPQYTAIFRKWDVNPQIKHECFDFTPPKDAMRLDAPPKAGRDK